MASRRRDADTDLLPESFDEFRSVKFWDGFFAAREERPFEWYGDWKQLQPLLRPHCTPQKELLMVGCGNSELSAELYDVGCHHITNIDFSRKVIASMLAKNVRTRPKMKWKVGDMTALQFGPSSFDVVLDKGGLDALMGEDSEESTKAGKKLLNEADRVLRDGGCYICISLVQSHVLNMLLERFREGWVVSLSCVPPPPDMARSPLQPFLIVAHKDAASLGELTSTIAAVPSAPNAEQRAETMSAIDAEQAARKLTGSKRINQHADCLPEGFDELHPGRRVLVDLPIGISTSGKHHRQSKYTAWILDLSGPRAESAKRQCCVFIVPQGRESEWLFASEKGQHQVAEQCSSQRVVFVTLNRGHVFGTEKAIQAELSPLVKPLAPAEVRNTTGAVPIVTTDEGVGRRREVEVTESSISGQIVVEDVVLRDAGNQKHVRRLVFISNRGLIQSEAVLKNSASSKLSDASSGKKRSKQLRKASSLAGQTLPANGSAALQLDHSSLSMEYHNHIVACICMSGCLVSSPSPEQKIRRQCLLVGLGGGALAVYLQHYLAVHTVAVELDEAVVRLAERHFGLQSQSGPEVKVGDGLDVVSQIAGSSPGSLDILVVDAGSGDASQAMSCPPLAFLEDEFLQSASKALRTSGLFAMNCVTRLDPAFRKAVKAVQSAFSHVYISEVEEDVNRVIYGTQAEIPQAELTGTHLVSQLVQGHGNTAAPEQIQGLADHFSGLRCCTPNF